MMKKKWFLLIALLLTLGVVWYIINEKKSEKALDPSDFAVDNTEEVSKILLKDRNGRSVLLRKNKERTWTLNDSLLAREDAVEMLLTTLSKLRVKGPVGSNARNNVIRAMASQAVKVEIFKGEDAIKTIYVGGHTPDQFGTYMYIGGTKSPWVVHIPGFDGFLTPRFSTDSDDWQSRKVFDFDQKLLQSVSVQYPSQPEASFKISRNGEDYTVEAPAMKDPKSLNFGAVSSYFNNFKNITFEGYPPFLQNNRPKQDSILNSLPYCMMEVRDIQGNVVKVNIWQKEARTDLSLYDNQGNLLAYDPERYYAEVQESRRIVHIQIYVFQNIMVRFQDFLLKTAS